MKDISQNTLSAAIAGDRSAQSAIVHMYSERIYNLGLHLLKNGFDAEDLLQETFIKVFENLKNFEGKSNLYTWIYRIATNLALMKMRKGKNEMLVDDFIEKYDVPEERQSTGEVIPMPMYSILNKELKTELDTALDKLPDIYKTVFILRDIEGLSTREASKVLDITENNVKVRLKRARNYLRDELCTYFENCKSA
jgi:RNA polymerase sigma-70 factor (ECF subfamily)